MTCLGCQYEQENDMKWITIIFGVLMLWVSFEIGYLTAPHMVNEVISTQLPAHVASKEMIDSAILQEKQTRAMYAAIMGLTQENSDIDFFDDSPHNPRKFPIAKCLYGCGSKTDGVITGGVQSNIQTWEVYCNTAESGQSKNGMLYCFE